VSGVFDGPVFLQTSTYFVKRLCEIFNREIGIHQELLQGLLSFFSEGSSSRDMPSQRQIRLRGILAGLIFEEKKKGGSWKIPPSH